MIFEQHYLMINDKYVSEILIDYYSYGNSQICFSKLEVKVVMTNGASHVVGLFDSYEDAEEYWLSLVKEWQRSKSE